MTANPDPATASDGTEALFVRTPKNELDRTVTARVLSKTILSETWMNRPRS